jgi:hypothetical protein
MATRLDTCSCYGLNLLNDMGGVMAAFIKASNREDGNYDVPAIMEVGRKAKISGRYILNHLDNAVSNLDENRKKDVQADLEYIRNQNNLLQNADQPMIHYDSIRDKIHTSKAIQKLFVCDPEGASTESQVIGEVFEIMGKGDLLKARNYLKDMTEILCSL